MVVTTIVEDTKWDYGFSNGACTKEVDKREGPNDCHRGKEIAETML